MRREIDVLKADNTQLKAKSVAMKDEIIQLKANNDKQKSEIIQLPTSLKKNSANEIKSQSSEIAKLKTKNEKPKVSQ